MYEEIVKIIIHILITDIKLYSELEGKSVISYRTITPTSTIWTRYGIWGTALWFARTIEAFNRYHCLISNNFILVYFNVYFRYNRHIYNQTNLHISLELYYLFEHHWSLSQRRAFRISEEQFRILMTGTFSMHYL